MSKKPLTQAKITGNDLTKIIASYQQKIQQLDYQPLTDKALTTLQKAREDAIDNNRLEGIYDDEIDRAFDLLFWQTRLPVEFQQQIIIDFVSNYG